MSGSEWSFYVERSDTDRPSESEEYCYGKFGIAEFVEGCNVPNAARAAVRRRIARALGVEARRVFLTEKLEVILEVDRWPDNLFALAQIAWHTHNVEHAAALCLTHEAIQDAQASSQVVMETLRMWDELQAAEQARQLNSGA